MEPTNIDLNFLSDTKKVHDKELGEGHPNRTLIQEIPLHDFDKASNGSEFNDLSYLHSKKSKKVSKYLKFKLDHEPAEVTGVDIKPQEGQLQSDEFDYTIDEPLTLPKEDKEQKIEVVDLKPPQDLLEADFSELDFEEPLVFPEESNSEEGTEFQLEGFDGKDLTPEEHPEVKSESVLGTLDTYPTFLTDENVDEPLIQPKEIRQQNSKHEKPEFISDAVEKKSVEVKSPNGALKQNLFSKSINLGSLFENSKLLGLDIGSNSLKYVILKKSARGLRLLDCGLRAIPAASQDTSEGEKKALLIKLLQANLKGKALKNTLITSVVAGLEVLFLNVRVPKVASKEMSQAVQWACKKDIPFPVESTIVAHQILNNKDKKTDGKLDVLVVAAHKGLVSKHLDLLKGAEITPTKVSTVPVALLSLFKMSVKKEADKCYAIIDIGAESSHIVFINKGQLQFTREIATAGEEFTEALTGVIFIEGTEITVSRSRADQLKKQYGFPDVNSEGGTKEGIPLKEISVMMRPILERLVNEIQRTIDFYKERFRVDNLIKVFLTGGGALLTNLAPNLSQRLDLEVEILRPFETISTKKILNRQELERIAPRFAVAVGLALDRNKELNLIPPSLKSVHILQIFKKVFRYLFILLVLIMTLLSQNIIQKAEEIKNQFTQVSQEYKNFEPKRRYYLELENKLRSLKVENKIYESEIAVNLNAANHLKIVSNLIPRNIALTSLRIEYRHEKVNDKDNDFVLLEILIMQGVAFADNSMEGINLARFLLELEKSNYFASIALKNQKIREDGNLEFILECQT